MNPYSKMPLAKLKEIEADILNKNPDLQTRLNLYNEEQSKLNKLKQEHESIQRRITQEHESIQGRIKQIREMAIKRKEQEYSTAGRLKKFFIDKTSPNFTEAEMNEIIRLNRIIPDKIPDKPWANKFQSAYSINERLRQIRRLISKREKEEAKRNADKAVIAAYKGKSRSLADQIKFELKEQLSIDSRCPYCGLDIGDDPHCDHIYPVSKGGLSTTENMVYVCSDCNLKKTHLTLTQFIKKYGFFRVEVERRLDKLGKHY